MVWQGSFYLQLSGVTLAIALNLAAYAWPRRRSAIGKAFIILMAGIAEWSLMTVLQLCSESYATQAFWHKLWYVGIAVVPVAWFVFVLIYTGRERYLTRRNLLLLAVMPALTIAATFTDDYFHLMFREVVWDTSGTFPLLVTMPNFWFWMHTIYSYSLMLLSLIWLLKAAFDRSFMYRKQVGILLLGSLVPYTINFMFVLGPELPGHVDPTPAAFAVTGIVAFWGLMQFHLLDIMPVARDTIIKDIRDGIIIVDTMNHIVDLNPAAQGITGYSTHEVIGKPLGDAFPGKEKEFDYLYSAVGDTEVELGKEDTKRYYKIHTSPLYQRDNLRGHLILLYDVTEQKKTEQNVRELRTEQQKLQQELMVNVRDKREFMESVAEELRASFGRVLAGCSDIGSAPLPEPFLKNLQDVHAELVDLDRRARMFLEFLQMETGTIKMVAETIDVLPVLKETVQEILPLYQAKGCSISFKSSESLSTVFADEIRMRQVILILLGTALALLKPGGQAGLSADRRSGFGWIEIRLEGVTIDTGEGLFNPYAVRTGEPTTGRRVGLALSKQLVELSGGQLLVDSQPGRGTRFAFSLPLAQKSAEE